MKIGDLIEDQCLIYIVLWFGLSCLHCLSLILFLHLSPTMFDIYCHEDVLDFTNPFLDFEQGYQVPRKIATIPVSPKTILPEEPLTCRGYPRGKSQGDLSGRVNLPSFLIGCADWFFTGFINLRDGGTRGSRQMIVCLAL